MKNLKPCIQVRVNRPWIVHANGPSVNATTWTSDGPAGGEGETWDEPLTRELFARVHFSVRSNELNTRCVS